MYFHALKDRDDFGNPVSDIEFLPENNQQDRVITFEEQQKYLKIPLNAAALGIMKKRAGSAEGAYLFPHRKDADEPILRVNNSHDRALKNLGGLARSL
jgi:hypothetical protein